MLLTELFTEVLTEEKMVRIIPHGKQVHIRVCDSQRNNLRESAERLGVSQVVLASDALAIGLRVLNAQGVQ